MRHLQGENRFQTTLLPDSLEDYAGVDHPVRVIDAFVDTLDLYELGFSKAHTKDTGRKPYHPGDLLKLYLYGYLNQVHTSRRLEKECQRNLEVLWLLRRLAPDFKTIADFRKDNGAAVRGACRAFIQFCRQAELLTGRLVAIDGSKFKAAGSKYQALTRKQLQRDRKKIAEQVDNYLARLDWSDRHDADTGLESERVQRALETLKAKSQQLDEREAIMTASGSNQHCVTEPEAKLMRTGREGIVLGYNVQSAVDADTGLIVYHEVVDIGTDNGQLLPIATGAKAALGVDALDVIADAGYSNGEHLHACEEQKITATVPRKRSLSSYKDCFQKRDFYYDAKGDRYICPAGETLHFMRHDHRRKHTLYTRKGCSGCALQPLCTTVDKRTITRHFYEEAFYRSAARLKADPTLMKQRMAIVERPFAVLKQAMGLRRFVCWGMDGAKTETSIAILGYNLKRMIAAQGVPRLLALMA